MKKDLPVVVIGGGAAGLMAALSASASKEVLILTKGKLGGFGESASSLAQGGIAAAIGEGDSPLLHAMDTLKAGCGISEREPVATLTSSAPKVIEGLLSIGARFDLDSAGEISLGKEAAHSQRRIIHANGDATGKEIMRALALNVMKSPKIKVIEGALARELLLSENGECRGVVFIKDKRENTIQAAGCILATGGIGNLYKFTTNPLTSDGEGLSLAATLGAKLDSLEFVQFHPTALAVRESPLPLLTEAIRGEGGMIVDDKGGRFIFEVHKDGELAPRDIVSREIFKKQREGVSTFLDVRSSIGESFKDKFPGAYLKCMQHGINPLKDLIPITPAAHYHMGGITTDEWGRTSVQGLWACGEVASTGIHGANRLASNSLLEALVFGDRAGKDAASFYASKSKLCASKNIYRKETTNCSLDLEPKLKSIMWDKVGIIRDKEDLTLAYNKFFEVFEDANVPSLKSSSLVCALIAFSALNRTESRGGHFREDYPGENKKLCRRMVVQCVNFGGGKTFDLESLAA